ncbi:SCO7613 C-terminal domain-containing membrane protein [Nonomuraea sp. 3N208]|uniref:SCO7613 C-terminal domain-containing membrane protein n=1 Tax=Nonomuraea sp. 3N208 TaxID=3457421 RepID=UPI003FD4396C
MDRTTPACPGCGAGLPGSGVSLAGHSRPAACPECRLLLRGPAADAYYAAVAALAEVEERRTELVTRRDEALTAMRAASRVPAPVSAVATGVAANGGTANGGTANGPSTTATADATGTTSAAANATPATANATGTATTTAVASDAGGRARTDAVARAGAGGKAPGRDLSHRAVQNLLLLLGGVLLSIAAVVFTLVSWQVPALRALILSVFTLAVLAAPWLLVRRRLVATAETVALVGLVLIPLDGVAVLQVFDDGGPSGGPGPNPLWGFSLGGAALALGWALYARWAPLRLPTPVAIVLAQAPLPLAGLAVELEHTTGWAWFAAALTATAAFDLALWHAARRARAAVEYVTAAVAGSLIWLAGTGVIALQEAGRSASDSGSQMPMMSPPVAALILAASSVLALLWAAATRGRAARLLIATCGALAAIGAIGVVPASMVPALWQAAVVAYGACLVLAATLKLPVRLRDGMRTGAVLALAASAVSKAPAVLTAGLAPMGWLSSIWSDAGGPAAHVLGPHDLVLWEDTAATPLVMGAVALGMILLPSLGPTWTPELRRTVCLVFGSLAVLTAPVATGMPYEAALAVLVALAGALLLTAARQGRVPGTAAAGQGDSPGTTTATAGGAVTLTPHGQAALWLGGYVAVLAMCWALADRQATIGVAAGLMMIALAGAVAARPKAVQAAGGAGATLAAGLLVWALFENGPGAAFALLGVRAVTLVVTRPSRRLATAVVRARRTTATLALGGLDRLTRTIKPGGRTAVEAAAVAVGVFTLAQQGVRGELMALVLAIGAVLAAGSAWRRPRGLWRTAAAVEACVLAALAPLAVSTAVVPALVGPYQWVTHAWAGAAEGARQALSPSGPWQEQPLLLPVLVLAGGAGTLAAWARWGRPAAMGVARVVFPLAATTLPVAADLPYWAALAFLVALTAGLALWSAVSRSAVGSAGLWTATLAVSWSLADRTATLAVLAAIVVTGVLCAIRGKGSPVTSVASTVTGLAVGAESVAAALGGGLGPENAALVLLLVAVLLSRAAALPVLSGAIAGPAGGAALVLWLVTMILTADDPARLSLVLAVGALALAGGAGRLRDGARTGAYVLAAAASGAAVLPHLSSWGTVLQRPYSGAGHPWSERFDGWSTSALAHVWVGPRGEPLEFEPAGFALSGVETALGVGVFVAVTGVIVARGLARPLAGRTAATVGAVLCLVLVPAVADLPYPGTLAFYGVLLVALAAQAALGPRAGAAGVLAVGLGVHLVVWSLDAEASTLVVLAGVAVLGVVTAVLARNDKAGTGAAASATVATGALAIASALSAGFRAEGAGFAALAVAALSAVVSAALARRPSTSDDGDAAALATRTGDGREGGGGVAVAVEVPGWSLAAIGLILTQADADCLSLALTCAGLLALAVALRPDRRPAVWGGLILLQFALWLRLAISDVTAPEAYTVSLSVAGLVVAWLARRRDPGMSSWLGYGTALALTFLPSAYAAWNDVGLTRPLLLGAAAFAATMTGAWARLQAPLILGGAVLVVTAAHEFAPTLAELMGEGPRWLPIALAGAFLLFTGATYEHRLRDLRKIRRFIVRMR